jgi:DNA-binding winged helix-turn-helix (wHTH) protein
MKVRFGAFTLDGERRLLIRDGNPVHLSPKAYELLVLLLARRPAAVSKQEIHDHLWPRTFVADISVATVMVELRTALGEHGRGSRVIRTVHGFGYAFDADATDEAGAVSAPDAPLVMPPAPDPCACVVWLEWQGREFRLSEGSHIVGRAADADIRVDVSSVSRHHARIVRRGCEAVVEDLASKNGTSVRGVKVDGPVHLADGDEIRFGSAAVVFRNLLEPRATATVRDTSG